jgi:hypothetical protein
MNCLSVPGFRCKIRSTSALDWSPGRSGSAESTANASTIQPGNPNPNGKTIYANRVALAYTVLSLDEVQADDFRDRVFHHRDVQRLRARLYAF